MQLFAKINYVGHVLLLLFLAASQRYLAKRLSVQADFRGYSFSL